MPNIQINIKNKVARADRAIIVCDNSDYTAVFDFDAEWDEYTTKTARFVYGGRYTDVVFSGNECAVPVMQDTRAVTVGVFAGDLHTTTPAYISCVPSILCCNGIPADPTPDVYNQIMEMLNKESGIWYPAVDDAGNMSWTRSMSETEPQPVNIKGPKGDAGADGVDGKSAYELAQDNGFAGTMQEWLASLVGADGTNGADGNDGISPAVSVTAITGGNRITITDAEGAKTFDVMDGAQGASGADGKDYVLTDTDKQEIAEAAAGFVDVPSVQHDWNQNDSTQPDYIKNRPFYTGNPVETVLVEESTVSFAENHGLYMAQFPSTFEATVGETYKVSWDGTVYECTCVDINNVPIIGNLSIIGAGSDTGEPFIMDISKREGILIATADTSASHTISITTIEQPITKIDTKYIPWSDAVGFKPPVIISKSENFTDDEKQKYFDAFKNGALVLYLGDENHAGVVVSAFYAKSVGFRMTVIDAAGNVNIYNSSGGWSSNKISKGGIIGTINDVLSDTTSWMLLKSSSDSVSIGEAFSAIIQWNSTTKKPCIYKQIRTSTSGVVKIENSDIFCSGDKDVILSSSTADSTKKFKITVDDSGAITATEVS